MFVFVDMLQTSSLPNIDQRIMASQSANPNKEEKQHSVAAELEGIERQLKNWFLTRRVLMERHLSLKKLFDANHVSGMK